MAKLPSTQRITQEELQGDADQKIQTILSPINLFFNDVRNALDRDLTFGDNVDSQMITLSIQTSSAYPTFTPVNFQLTMRNRPHGAQVVYIKKTDDIDYVFTSAVWADVYFPAGESYGTVRHITGLAASTNYKVTLFVV